MLEREEKRVQSKKAADKRWEKSQDKAKVDADAYADAMPGEERRGEERREEKSKEELNSLSSDDKSSEKKKKRFVPPTIDEIKDYFKSKSESIEEATKFYNFYESKGWMVGKNKMQKWKGAAGGWISRNGKSVAVETKDDVKDEIRTVIASIGMSEDQLVEYMQKKEYTGEHGSVIINTLDPLISKLNRLSNA